MATLGTTMLTLADHAKRTDPSGKTSDIVEILDQTNTALTDMVFKECNQKTAERVTQRTGLPTTYYRMMNQGTPPSKSTTSQITEDTAMLSSRSHIDVREARLNGDVNEYRRSEGMAHIEGMGQDGSTTLWYGSNANPEEYVGFSNRYNDKSAANGQNIIDAGGTGSDNSSIWLIGWSTRTVYGVFPEGSTAGVQHQDLGEDDVNDSDGNPFRAYKDLYELDNGLVLKDWRYAVRIANVDISTLIADDAGATTNLINLMIKATHRLPSKSNVKLGFYANRTICEMLDVQAANKSSVQLSVGEEEGKLKTRLRGITINTDDALTEAEAQVT